MKEYTLQEELIRLKGQLDLVITDIERIRNNHVFTTSDQIYRFNAELKNIILTKLQEVLCGNQDVPPAECPLEILKGIDPLTMVTQELFDIKLSIDKLQNQLTVDDQPKEDNDIPLELPIEGLENITIDNVAIGFEYSQTLSDNCKVSICETQVPFIQDGDYITVINIPNTEIDMTIGVKYNFELSRYEVSASCVNISEDDIENHYKRYAMILMSEYFESPDCCDNFRSGVHQSIVNFFKILASGPELFVATTHGIGHTVFEKPQDEDF